MPFQLEIFGISDIGKVRSNNEDVWKVIPEKHFFILADGMGGHNAGEVAASIAVESMCQSIQDLPLDSSIEETCQFLRKAISLTNTRVFEEASHHPDWSGMGTTLSCFIIKENTLIYAHVGDSRIYRYREGLIQLTEDHSLRNTYPLKEKDYMRNVITRAIGTQPLILPDIGVISTASKDIYMLCSDGLSDYVKKKEIAEIFTTSSHLEEIGKKLIKAALEKGGNDNITLLLTQISDEKDISR